MQKRNCIVKYADTFGIEHSVRVEAESLFDAAIRGLQRLHSSLEADVWDRISITVEVHAEPTIYGVMIQKLKPWMKSEESRQQKGATTERLRLSPRIVRRNLRWGASVIGSPLRPFQRSAGHSRPTSGIQRKARTCTDKTSEHQRPDEADTVEPKTANKNRKV